MDDLRNYIGGQFLTHSGGQWMDNPELATGSHICRIPLSDASDVDAAVDAARGAQPLSPIPILRCRRYSLSSSRLPPHH